MFAPVASFLIFGFLGGAGIEMVPGHGFLYQPAYAMDDGLRGRPEPYLPQPGDIYLATDRSWIIRAGHWLATSGAPHHSGIVIAKPDGRMGILESGPFNTLKVAIVDLHHDLDKHENRGEKVWIRQRRTPLSPEESAQLTAWAEAQNHKRFAAARMLRQLTPFRCRGPLRTYYLGHPQGEHGSYFCSELVLETCVAVKLLSPEDTRPTATYPRDLFFDESPNRFLKERFTLVHGWHPPARWTAAPVEAALAGTGPGPALLRTAGK